jgi:hypothetical protein
MSRRQYIDDMKVGQPRPHARIAQEDLRPSPVEPAASAQPRQLKTKTRRFTLRGHAKTIILGLCVIIILLAVGGFIYHRSNQPRVVPKKFASQLSFPIYYPDPKKLPAGYTINEQSFNSPQTGVLLYSVDYGSGQKLIFSNQARPSSDTIQNFYTNYIPLRNQMNTTLGQAQIGAYGSGKNLKTVVSLPINKTWVIVTAPYNVNQNQLKQVLNALKT